MGPRLLELRIVVCVLFATLCSAAQLSASPAMIRLGYAGCQACHLSPQGRGLLTEYGKGIDDTQSARHGVYDADEDRWRRLFQDVRLMTQLTSEAREQPERATSAAVRLWYRNTTRLSHTFRVSGTLSVDAPARAQEVTTLQPQPSQPQVFVRQALLEITPHKNVYVAIGRDTLPSGVEIADQATYMRVAQRPGAHRRADAGQAVLVDRAVPGGAVRVRTERARGAGFRSSGAGVLAEKYLFGDRLAAGVSLRMARNPTFDERLTGVYARFGMGRWGVLTEHDLVRRGERSGERTPLRPVHRLRAAVLLPDRLARHLAERGSPADGCALQ